MDRCNPGCIAGRLRGETDRQTGHCNTAAIPTLEEEEAPRPTREQENLVGERARIINRLKAALPVSVSVASIQNCAALRSASHSTHARGSTDSAQYAG
jgi:hypothetical protein